MEDKINNSIHSGHRERMREKYRAAGLEAFSSHEVLELLLFYANKRSDTNPVAHRLIDRFGSLPAVLEAEYDDLIKIDGVGDTAATLITLMPRLFRRYTSEKAEKIKTVRSFDDLKDYLMPRFYGINVERVALLCFDSQGRINNFVFASEGSLKLAQIDMRKIAQLVLQNNAESIIVVHNHPGGVASPSRSDIEATTALVKSMGLINVRVVDHVIISDEDAFSMASSEKFSPMFIYA